MKLRIFAVSVHGSGWGETTVYAFSSGRAKYLHWLHVKDAWPDVPFTAMRCRVARKSPTTTEAFRRTAEARGVPFARIGMRVISGGHEGIIVDRNDSANFQVAFSTGPHAGQTCNCHPLWKMRYFDDAGGLIFDSDCI